MTVTVLKELISQGLDPQAIIDEVIPSKGKPAQKTPGSTTVYIVKIRLRDKESVVESSRGTPREWSDFNTLVKWFKSMGIHDYRGTLSNPEQLLQQTLAFNSNGK